MDRWNDGCRKGMDAEEKRRYEYHLVNYASDLTGFSFSVTSELSWEDLKIGIS